MGIRSNPKPLQIDFTEGEVFHKGSMWQDLLSLKVILGVQERVL